jgi:hypothetical protein
MSRVRWAGVVPLWVALACGGLGQSDRHEIVFNGDPVTSGAADEPREDPIVPALDDEPLQSVPETAIAAPKLYACVQGTRLSEPDPLDARPIEVISSGTIIEIGVGPPGPATDGTCPFIGRYYFGGSFFLEDLDLLAQQTWIRIREASGDTITLAIVASGFEFRDLVGEAVNLHFYTSLASFSPGPSWLELRRSDGALLLWLSHALRVEELLGASDVERSLGAVDGEDSGECVTSWERRRVNITLDGTHTSVGYRQQAAVGSWRVTNGGVVIQTGESRCDDAYALSASLAVWTAADTVAYTSGIGGWCDPALTAEVGNYYDGKSFVCLEGEGSEGYLSMSCESDEGCLPGSACSEGLCRATD